jgi:hypothetical protein
MYRQIGGIVHLLGFASVVVGVVLAAHHLNIEIPIVAGVAAIYLGNYLKK